MLENVSKQLWGFWLGLVTYTEAIEDTFHARKCVETALRILAGIGYTRLSHRGHTSC